jgi:hypothetical protein
MKLKCAWCEREGRPANVGEVEPVENRSETHGLCPEHHRKWLESLGISDHPPAAQAPPPA